MQQSKCRTLIINCDHVDNYRINPSSVPPVDFKTAVTTIKNPKLQIETSYQCTHTIYTMSAIRSHYLPEALLSSLYHFDVVIFLDRNSKDTEKWLEHIRLEENKGLEIMKVCVYSSEKNLNSHHGMKAIYWDSLNDLNMAKVYEKISHDLISGRLALKETASQQSLLELLALINKIVTDNPYWGDLVSIGGVTVSHYKIPETVFKIQRKLSCDLENLSEEAVEEKLQNIGETARTSHRSWTPKVLFRNKQSCLFYKDLEPLADGNRTNGCIRAIKKDLTQFENQMGPLRI